VTDQDIRDDVVYASVTNSTASYRSSDLDDQMEVFLMQLHVETGPQNPSSFNLVVNHKHCIASYVCQEVQDKNFHFLDPNTRTSLQELLCFLAELHNSESKAPSLLELSLEAPRSCPYPRESSCNICRCLDVVLRMILMLFYDS
jgi:hypothetical protein